MVKEPLPSPPLKGRGKLRFGFGFGFRFHYAIHSLPLREGSGVGWSMFNGPSCGVVSGAVLHNYDTVTDKILAVLL